MINDENFAHLFRQTPELVCLLSGPLHRFEFVNPAHVQVLGFDATGLTVREAQPESVEVHGILDDVYRTGVTAELREIPVTVTDRVRYFDLTYAAHRDEQDRIDGIMVLGSEVTGRVLARRAQENHRHWLESMLDLLPIPKIFIEPHSARIVYQNRAAKELLERVEIPHSVVTRAAAGERLQDEVLELHGPRGTIIVECSADLAPQEFGQPATAILVLKDVTAQVLAQRQLARSEERLSLALETSRVGFYDWNVREDLLVFNPQMCADWGIWDWRGMTLDDAFSLIHPDDRGWVRGRVQSAITHGEPYHVEYRVMRPDGRIIWVEVQGRVHRDERGPVRFFGTSVDVSERVESERALRALANSMPQIVWAARPDGVVDYLNQRWIEYSGCEDCSRWLDFVAPEEREEVLESWMECVRSGRDYEVECGLRRASDGTYRRHLVRAHPTFDAAGQVTRWFGACTDIEDQKRIEDALRLANLAAEEASAAKSVFLANMSHEIRTPLGAILGFIELIRSPSTNPERIGEFAAIVERNSRHLLRLVDDILNVTKVEAGQMLVEQLEFSLPALLAELGSLVGMKSRERGVGFAVVWATPLPGVIESDPTRLRQILMNIVGNALKFTERGEVRVTVSYEEPMLVFQVSDTGIGMSEEDQEKLFGVFSQGDASMTRRFGGTGLGLVLTRRLCEILGGALRLVHSAPGRGSSFEARVQVRVPVGTAFFDGEAAALPAPSEPAAALEDSLVGLRVLLVEDQPDNQMLLRLFLSEGGAEVVLAEDGPEGVQAALGGSYDVVLMDVQMPRLDGHSAARELRARGYRGPLIALTAHAMKEERELALRSGFSGFLAKPVTRELLLETVRAAASRERPTVWIVDDEDDMRDMVEILLTGAGYPCRSFANGDAVLAEADATRGQVLVLLDLSLPGIPGDELARRLLGRGDRARFRVVLTSGWGDLAARARELGAQGFLSKPFGTQELLRLVARSMESAA